MILISVIIPSFKRISQTITTIDLLRASVGKDREFSLEIIVADCSPDDSLQKAVTKKFGTEVVYTRPQKAGIATNKNQGAKIARGELLIFCDSDIEVEPDTIKQTVAVFQKNQTVGAVMGQVFWKHGPSEGKHDRPRKEDRMFEKDGVTYVEAIYSRYMATYADVFAYVGGFDEEVFNMRGEGSDLSLRYWRAGLPLVYSQLIKVHHVFDAPDSIALRVKHPEWGIAKDLLLLAYKYDILEDTNKNFIVTVAANFKPLGPDGYFNILQGIGKFMDLITDVKPIIDKQKKVMKFDYDFKHLEIFSDKKLLQTCLNSSVQKINSIVAKSIYET